MSIVVTINETTPAGVVITDTSTTVTTSLDFVAAATTADNVTVSAHNTTSLYFYYLCHIISLLTTRNYLHLACPLSLWLVPAERIQKH